MNYSDIYYKIINRATEKNKKIDLNVYSELHHIIPRCMGGDNNSSNLVRLNSREHYIAHWLLTKMYPKNTKLIHAFWMMQLDPYKLRHTSSRGYAYARNLLLNRKLSNETKDKISTALLGRRKTMKHREAMSKSKKGKPAWNRGQIMSTRGSTKSLQMRQRLSDTNRGRKLSESIKLKQSMQRSIGTYITLAGNFSGLVKAAKANRCATKTVQYNCYNQVSGWNFIPK